jgi:hypothetical protein
MLNGSSLPKIGHEPFNFNIMWRGIRTPATKMLTKINSKAIIFRAAELSGDFYSGYSTIICYL